MIAVAVVARLGDYSVHNVHWRIQVSVILKVHDVLCGYFVIKRRALLKIS